MKLVMVYHTNEVSAALLLEHLTSNRKGGAQSFVGYRDFVILRSDKMFNIFVNMLL